MNDRDESGAPPDEVLEGLRHDLGLESFTTPDGEAALRAEGTSLAVMKAVEKGASRGAISNGYRKVIQLLEDEFPPPLRNDSNQYEATGRDAAERLIRSIDAATEKGYRLFGKQLSSYDWLYMIRRLPMRHVWRPMAATSSRIRMSLLALSENDTPGSYPAGGVLNLSDHHGVCLGYLLGYTDALGQLVRAHRWVCKEGNVEIDFDAGRIGIGGPESLRERLELYDRRVYEGGGWGGFGIPLSEMAGIRAGEVGPPGEDEIMQVWTRREGQWASDEPDANFARYVEVMMEVGGFFDLLDHPSSPDIPASRPDLVPLGILLRALVHLVDRGSLRIEGVRRVGYSVHGGSPIGSGDFSHALSDSLSWAGAIATEARVPDSVEEVVSDLRGLEPSFSPLYPCPVLFSIEEGFVVDWHAASGRFTANLRVSTTDGEFASVRGPVFEEWLQEKIAALGYGPPDWLADLVNRQLSVNGEDIGEFDAAATLPGGTTHYLIECKSFLYSESYEVGDHSTIRNIDERLTDAAAGISTLTWMLTKYPDAGNWKIKEGHNLLPLVVVPRVMYSSSSLCWKKIPDTDWGPRLVSSASEFLRLLDRFTYTET